MFVQQNTKIPESILAKVGTTSESTKKCTHRPLYEVRLDACLLAHLMSVVTNQSAHSDL